MRLTTLEAEGVRNLSAISIDCAPGLNVFAGPNGAGKTAIIEAVHLIARGRSFRSTSIGAVITHGARSLTVRVRLDDEHRGEIRAGVVKHRNDRSELHLNGRIERRVSEIARLMPLQLLLPDASSLVFGAPQERRRFLDWGTFHVKPSYLDQLRDYQRTLQQRNVLLRAADRASGSTRELQAWTDQLSRVGARGRCRAARIPRHAAARDVIKTQHPRVGVGLDGFLSVGMAGRGNVGRLSTRRQRARCKIRSYALRPASSRLAPVCWRATCRGDVVAGPGQGCR